MGLFKKVTSDTQSKEELQQEDLAQFKSIIVESENVAREINAISLANNIAHTQLDFKLLKVKTALLLDEQEGWINADEEMMAKLKDRDFILNPKLKIKQLFKLEIFKTVEKQEKLPPIILSANKSLTKVIATIKKDLDITYYSNIENDIIDDINKKKIRAGIFVGLNDENMYDEVKKLIANLKVNGSLSQDAMFIACQGIEVVAPIDDDIIYHYRKKRVKADKEGKVDYSRRGFVLAVSQGECIIEYIKPQLGTPGRSCQGKYLAIKEPVSKNAKDIVVSENIAKKEDDFKIRYISQKNGYVSEVSANSFDIQDEVDIDKIDFKSTGSIETDMASKVTINIKENDIFKDAIGPGMSVETHELNVEGNIASGAKIKAEILVVGGQTHKTSVIHADKATIAVHRGSLSGGELEVTRLEGGRIVGDTVKVKQAIGGEIIASVVLIDELASNVTITASNKIEIQKLQGGNNKFIIDPKATPQFEKEIKTINAKIKAIESSLRGVPKMLEERKNLIKKSKNPIEMVKNKIIELKKDGKTPPSAFFVKIKEFQNIINNYNNDLKEYKDKKSQQEEFKNELSQIQSKIFEAKIINHSSWSEYNEIKFRLISPVLELSYTTKAHEVIREFSLREDEQGEFKIHKSSEYSPS